MRSWESIVETKRYANMCDKAKGVARKQYLAQKKVIDDQAKMSKHIIDEVEKNNITINKATVNIITEIVAKYVGEIVFPETPKNKGYSVVRDKEGLIKRLETI